MGKFKSLSRKTKITLAAVIAFIALAASSSHTPQPTTVQLSNPSAKQSKTAVLSDNTTTKPKTAKAATKPPIVTTNLVTEAQPIPFVSTTVNSASFAVGTSKITTVGINGISTLTYKVTLTDGKQTAKQLVGQITTTMPVNQVTTIGTYVAPAPTPAPVSQPSCPNGTYLNSAGNSVCSPYQSNSTPAGATAQCTDGTYSFSQSHSGTCSRHGGVSSWL